MRSYDAIDLALSQSSLFRSAAQVNDIFGALVQQHRNASTNANWPAGTYKLTPSELMKRRDIRTWLTRVREFTLAPELLIQTLLLD